jgi:hypothetical protein
MIGSFTYLLLAGATVPTQRAFVMTGLVLLAVLLDRQAHRNRLPVQRRRHQPQMQAGYRQQMRQP